MDQTKTLRSDFVAANNINGAEAYTAYLKRWLDIGLTLILLPLVIPIIVLLSLLIQMDGGPGFFRHRRVGKGGTEFGCLKLRTMAPNAAELLDKLLRSNQAAADQWAAERKLDNDPRITRLGNILRRTSLDELPQLWNVLRGEMSLVGPRPVPRDELVKYAENASAYKRHRPGITGMWQVSGRNSVSYARRVELDSTYSRSVCFMLDIQILAKTFFVVVRRTGQ